MGRLGMQHRGRAESCGKSGESHRSWWHSWWHKKNELGRDKKDAASTYVIELSYSHAFPTPGATFPAAFKAGQVWHQLPLIIASFIPLTRLASLVFLNTSSMSAAFTCHMIQQPFPVVEAENHPDLYNTGSSLSLMSLPECHLLRRSFLTSLLVGLPAVSHSCSISLAKQPALFIAESLTP